MPAAIHRLDSLIGVFPRLLDVHEFVRIWKICHRLLYEIHDLHGIENSVLGFHSYLSDDPNRFESFDRGVRSLIHDVDLFDRFSNREVRLFEEYERKETD